jgi:hypothetical protein
MKVDPGEVAHGPQLLPGGRHLLYTVGTAAAAGSVGTDWDQAQVFVQSVEPGSTRQRVIEAGSDARYVSTGHRVYALRGVLFAVPFDLARLEVTGGAVPVVEGVRRALATGSAQFSFSNTGSLIYSPGPFGSTSASDRVLATLDRQGGLERLKVPPKAYMFARVSPADGNRVAVSTDDARDMNVWIVDVSGAAAPRQLTLVGTNRYPVWSVDGERVAFQSDREGDLGIFSQRADGTGTAERLTKPDQGGPHSRFLVSRWEGAGLHGGQEC